MPEDSLLVPGGHIDLKGSPSSLDGTSLPGFAGGSQAQSRLLSDKVGILGAGIAGLYTALILDSLDIKYEILEASDRSGGRIFTYKFPGGGKYDYYDAGAMRFPLPERDGQGQYKNDVTKRLAELIEYGPLNEGQDQLKDALIPFYMNVKKGSKPSVYYFNGTHKPPFGADAMGVGAEYIRAGVEEINKDITEPFVRKLEEDIETGRTDGWEALMANDCHSMRSYMATKYIPSPHLGLLPQHLPNNVIDWCGIFGAGTEFALSESVLMNVLLSSIITGNTDVDENEQWRCFEGGLEVLPKKIEEYLKRKGTFIRFEKRVTAIGQDRSDIGTLTSRVVDKDETANDSKTRKIGFPSVVVTTNGSETHEYSHVISTLPISVLRTIDLSGAGLDVIQSIALRELQYAGVLKVGILFKSNWWTTKLGIVGGQSLTDLPIRLIVYPSYGVDSSTPSRVLIASYSWGGDALRLSSLATSTKHPDALKELVLRNLAEAHSGLHPDVTYEYLNEQFVDIHIRDWTHDENAMGSFAIFKPGDFQDYYPSITRPAAGGCLHFAGEAVSNHHAWIIGALHSSWRAVHEYLEVSGQDEKMKKFKLLWGENPDWVNRSAS